jgi:hypothetical protein
MARSDASDASATAGQCGEFNSKGDCSDIMAVVSIDLHLPVPLFTISPARLCTSQHCCLLGFIVGFEELGAGLEIDIPAASEF